MSDSSSLAGSEVIYDDGTGSEIMSDGSTDPLQDATRDEVNSHTIFTVALGG
jgi:hypothetical protein